MDSTAACNGHLVIVKYIEKYLENKNPTSNTGMTPLHSAAKNGHLEIVKFLVEKLVDKQWTEHSQLQTARLSHAASVINDNCIYVFAGIV